MIRKQQGQSLIEVLVVTAILALMLTGIVSIVTLSVSNNRKVKTKTVAVRLVQEGIDYVRAQRDNLDWVAFAGTFSPCPGDFKVCLNDLSVFWPDSACSSPGYDLSVGNINYRREAELKCGSSDENFEVHVEVVWEESGGQATASGVTKIIKRPR